MKKIREKRESKIEHYLKRKLRIIFRRLYLTLGNFDEIFIASASEVRLGLSSNRCRFESVLFIYIYIMLYFERNTTKYQTREGKIKRERERERNCQKLTLGKFRRLLDPLDTKRMINAPFFPYRFYDAINSPIACPSCVMHCCLYL